MKTKLTTSSTVTPIEIYFYSLNRRYSQGLISSTGWTKAHQPHAEIKTCPSHKSPHQGV